jgi:uncharacterized protein YmfQ (DUF2313 family)
MAAPQIFGDLDFKQALLRLSPRGRVWRRDVEANFPALLGALAPSYTRTAAAALQLLVDVFPGTTFNLLPEWEASLGLPDPCTAPDPTFQERLAAVAAKFSSRGGQSVRYFINLAALLGFTVTIDQFWPFSADDPCDGPDYDPDWAFVWQVNAPQIETFYFRADESASDDPLASYDNTELACRMQMYAPAQTKLIFVFS